MERRDALHLVADRAADFLESLASRRVAPASAAECRSRLDRPLPAAGTPPEAVIADLLRDVEPGLVASAGPRYFGFVVGGAARAALMADWLTSAWDQNAQVYATSPAAAEAEAVASRWILELLGLPASCSVGFVTGGQMANFTALACARGAVLQRAGWDLEQRGLFGAPPVTVLTSECAHATVHAALALLGFGAEHVRTLPADAEGRLLPASLAAEVRRAAGRPLIVSLQAGNVNTGAFEAFDAVADLVRGENAWLHVDGAFGLWAAVAPGLRPLLRGFERADSWATDAHKWLNVPYDSGFVIVKDAARHRGLKRARCAYAGQPSDGLRDGSSYAPENSRRARAFVVYAALRELGAAGLRELVERCCRLARRFAAGAARLPGVTVLNEVVLNQVLVHVGVDGAAGAAGGAAAGGAAAETLHERLAAAIQADGRCWIGSTVWRGVPALRVSICNASTTEADVDLALQALADARLAGGDALSGTKA